MGDMNIAPLDADIGIGEDNKKRWLRDGKTSFLPEEREWLASIQAKGLTDSYRLIHPDSADRFGWFDYRSKGFEREPKRGLRIDLILTSKALTERVTDANIDYDARAMERPSITAQSGRSLSEDRSRQWQRRASVTEARGARPFSLERNLMHDRLAQAQPFVHSAHATLQ